MDAATASCTARVQRLRGQARHVRPLEAAGEEGQAASKNFLGVVRGGRDMGSLGLPEETSSSRSEHAGSARALVDPGPPRVAK